MKKIVYVLLSCLLVGCGEKKVEPIKDTVDQIKESKDSVVRLEVVNLMRSAEMKILSSGESCVAAKELSGRITSGSYCQDESGKTVAKDVKMEGYTCNGDKTTLKCVGDSND